MIIFRIRSKTADKLFRLASENKPSYVYGCSAIFLTLVKMIFSAAALAAAPVSAATMLDWPPGFI